MRGHPLILCLPGGKSAALIAGSDPARYDGWEGSVEIPADLSAWHWHGSFLSDGEVAIFTGTHPPPDCFEQARIHERLRAAWEPHPVQLVLF